jgi:hypothetical protein
MNSDSQTTSSSQERPRDCIRSDRGQATSEYALVMLAAALIALLAVGWASSGDGAGKIGQMFDRVIEDVTRRVP